MSKKTVDKAPTYATLAASNHAMQEREKNDFYATEPKATELLLEVETFDKNIWECANGKSHISKILEDHGYHVWKTDLIERGYEDETMDFLNTDITFDGDIITNPPFKCFDIGTQCFTKRGWLNYNELTYDDEILSVNPETQKLEWSEIDEIIIRDKQPEEKMYHFKKSHMDIMVTSGHRMFAFSKDSNRLLKCDGDLIKSETIRSNHYFPRCGYSWDGNEKKTFILPAIDGHRYAQPVTKEAIEIDMDAWLRFFGLWLADGYCRHTKNSQGNYRKTVGIKQLAKRRHEVEEILNALPFKYIEREDTYDRENPCVNFIINNEQLWKYLLQFGYSEDKFIPSEFKNLSSRQLKLLLDSYFFGDGSVYMENGKTFRTISKQLAEDVWEILLKLGYLSHITGINSTYKTFKGHEYNTYLINYNPNSVYNRVTFPSNKNDACLCEYTGKVWCVNLKKNGVFLLRRNGHEFVCGNCALQFCEKALASVQTGHKVAMFVKLLFLEGKSRKKFFQTNPPKTVYVSSSRLNCARNGEFENYPSSSVCYAWFVWEKGYKGDTVIKWIN